MISLNRKDPEIILERKKSTLLAMCPPPPRFLPTSRARAPTGEFQTTMAHNCQCLLKAIWLLTGLLRACLLLMLLLLQSTIHAHGVASIDDCNLSRSRRSGSCYGGCHGLRSHFMHQCSLLGGFIVHYLGGNLRHMRPVGMACFKPVLFGFLYKHMKIDIRNASKTG